MVVPDEAAPAVGEPLVEAPVPAAPAGRRAGGRLVPALGMTAIVVGVAALAVRLASPGATGVDLAPLGVLSVLAATVLLVDRRRSSTDRRIGWGLFAVGAMTALTALALGPGRPAP